MHAFTTAFIKVTNALALPSAHFAVDEKGVCKAAAVIDVHRPALILLSNAKTSAKKATEFSVENLDRFVKLEAHPDFDKYSMTATQYKFEGEHTEATHPIKKNFTTINHLGHTPDFTVVPTAERIAMLLSYGFLFKGQKQKLIELKVSDKKLKVEIGGLDDYGGGFSFTFIENVTGQIKTNKSVYWDYSDLLRVLSLDGSFTININSQTGSLRIDVKQDDYTYHAFLAGYRK